MYKKFIISQITLIYLLISASYGIIQVNAYSNNMDTNVTVNQAKISKDEVIKLIKEQGTIRNYYLDNLSYQLINIDNDIDLEIVAHTYGGVHLGYFFLFDKNADGRYFLAAERPWKVEKLSLQDTPNLTGDIKLHELTEISGGVDISVLTAHLWYLKDGKFIEAWQGTLKEDSVFQKDYGLTVGGYQYIQEYEKLHTWSSKYLIAIDTNISKVEPTTTISIYKFDGTKFILEVEEKCEHNKVLPNMKLR